MNQTLYRMWDEQGQLLYVGITLNLVSRFRDHEVSKAWWGEVATITLAAFQDRESVESAEREAIINENPRYNIMHTSREQWTLCPACQKISTYSTELDRYFHSDDSDNNPCWVAISRGETWPEFVHELRSNRG
jgi:predicted GIY-YIG superfamily endonuclease